MGATSDLRRFLTRRSNPRAGMTGQEPLIARSRPSGSAALPDQPSLTPARRRSSPDPRPAVSAAFPGLDLPVGRGVGSETVRSCGVCRAGGGGLGPTRTRVRASASAFAAFPGRYPLSPQRADGIRDRARRWPGSGSRATARTRPPAPARAPVRGEAGAPARAGAGTPASRRGSRIGLGRVRSDGRVRRGV